jgi:hypothetical protein
MDDVIVSSASAGSGGMGSPGAGELLTAWDSKRRPSSRRDRQSGRSPIQCKQKLAQEFVEKLANRIDTDENEMPKYGNHLKVVSERCETLKNHDHSWS